jgi:hypothetical protein
MKKISILFVILFSITILPQKWEQIDEVFAPSGVTVRDFSAPVFGDLDGDGDFDLVLGSIDLRIEYFRNIGTNQAPVFKKDTSMFSSIYAGGYQFTNAYYPALADLDNDGDLDLIIGGYNGLIYYENQGSPTAPVWVKIDNFFQVVNPQIGTDPRPAFADLDGDGDIDLLVGIGESLMGGPTPGITLGFRNIGTASSPNFQLDNTLVTGIPDVGLNAYPALADIDGDGDYDLLMGRDGAALFYYKNTGNASLPVWTRDFTLFAGVETVNYWKDPTFCDLDGDGDLDLIYGTDNGHLYFYQNTGTVTSPQFIHNPNYFKLMKSDGWSTPTFADYTGNGVLDMLSGANYGFFYGRNDGSIYSPQFVQTSSGFTSINPGFRSSPVFIDIDNDGDYDIVAGNSTGKLTLYINNNGSFTANTTMFANIQVSYASMPAFADINDDGNIDVLVGSDDNNSSKFYLNTGNNVFVQNTEFFAGVTFPRGSSPALCDVDNDGDYDLFIGRAFGGTVDFYENTGNNKTPVWTLNTELMAGIRAKQNAHPSFADLDGDGRKDLILGEYDGTFTFYKNLFAEVVPVELSSFTAERRGGKAILTWTTVTETNNQGFEIQRSNDKVFFTTIGFKKGNGTTTEEQYYSFTDDQVISGIIFYRLRQVDYDGTSKVSEVIEVSSNIPVEYTLEQNYPNPFNPSTVISFNIPEDGHVELRVFDVTGSEVALLVNEYKIAGEYKLQFNIRQQNLNLPSGVYMYQLKAGDRLFTKKMMMLK